MLPDDVSVHLGQLRQQGVVWLRQIFPLEPLAALRRAAQACFDAVEGGGQQVFPEIYRYNSLARSVLVGALRDFGCSTEELLAPISIAGLHALTVAALDGEMACHLEQSWVRKRYAPFHAPRNYHPNRWHQDGGLGVRFPPHAGSMVPMTRLLTCWVPLDPCEGDRPALEFVRRRLDSLLHYTEVDDATLRERFAPKEFWAPEVGLGDGLIFLNGTLHRTYVQPNMYRDRLSVEYRFFPASAFEPRNSMQARPV
ncbi:MAG TPA: hypothetical protein VG096_15405 [Bryobacteraceae bacterium]|nr:hypothetical protein [Bryobacteraceae bacterium]